MITETLPVKKVFPELKTQWEKGKTRFIIQAEPGAGKSTAVPCFLLESSFCPGKVIMLEPRRMAARSLAGYLSSRRGEAPGQSIGYRVRGESRVGSGTKLEIMTEGVFIRMIQEDPELSGVSAVILDEFHERNLFSDLAYAFLRDVQDSLRDDLRVIIMSATPEKELLEKAFVNAVYLESHGRMFPVELQWESSSSADLMIDYGKMQAAVSLGLKEKPGDVLVFLPGEGEISRFESRLKESVLSETCEILPLYGRLSLKEQDRVFKKSPMRKIILATPIAETSLTIPGITTVVDSGLERRPVFNRHSGLTRLETLPVSKASADQRKGRAGRVSEGLCIRMWSEVFHARLDNFREPELYSTDLSTLVLEAAVWGCGRLEDLNWLEIPPKAHFYQARELLTMLQAIDQDGILQNNGKKMAAMGLHPRLSAMILEGKRVQEGQTACCIAAILSERDWMGRKGDSDFTSRLISLKNGTDSNHPTVKRIAKLWASLTGGKSRPDQIKPEIAADLLLTAYPDRIAMKREGLSYQLSGGGACRLSETDSLQGSDFILALDAGGSGRESMVFLSLPLSRDQLFQTCPNLIQTNESVEWDEEKNRLKYRKITTLGALILGEQPLANPSAGLSFERFKRTLLKKGLSILPMDKTDQLFLKRCRFLTGHNSVQYDWPDFSDENLIENIENWFIPLLVKGRLEGKIRDGLKSLLSWDQQCLLDRVVPETYRVPSGSRIKIDYSDPEQPALDVRIQELFGLRDIPGIAGGIPLLIRLLNPAGRPIQMTRDLNSFWENTYPEVRKELRGRYPKHYWPENPYDAIPTSRVKPR